MRRGYLTPDSIPAATLRRWICIPDDPMILAAVNGAMLELTYPHNWEQYGTVTPEAMAVAMLPFVLDFQATLGGCMPIAHKPILLTDQKSQNTNGGTFTSGSFVTRTLNTKQGDDDEIITLVANQFTVPAGQWFIKWRAPVNSVNRHQTMLYDVQSASAFVMGSSGFASGSGDYSFGEITLNLASPTLMELRHRCQTSVANTGLGVAGNFGTEVYASVELHPLI